MSLSFSHREPLLRVDLYHAPQEVLAIGRDKVRDVELAALDLLQQLPKVVVVEGERAHQQGVQDHPAGPDVRPTTVVLLALCAKSSKKNVSKARTTISLANE